MVRIHKAFVFVNVALVVVANAFKNDGTHRALQLVKFREELKSAIDATRKSEGLDELCIVDSLADAAQIQATDMSEHNFVGNTGTDASTSQQRAEAEGFEGTVTELVAAGYTTASSTVDAWFNAVNSKKILLGNHNVMGFGYAYDKTTPQKHFWAVNFSKGECPAGSTPKSETSESAPAIASDNDGKSPLTFADLKTSSNETNKATPAPPGPSATPAPPGPSATPAPPGSSATPAPPGPSATPAPPGPPATPATPKPETRSSEATPATPKPETRSSEATPATPATPIANSPLTFADLETPNGAPPASTDAPASTAVPAPPASPAVPAPPAPPASPDAPAVPDPPASPDTPAPPAPPASPASPAASDAPAVPASPATPATPAPLAQPAPPAP